MRQSYTLYSHTHSKRHLCFLWSFILCSMYALWFPDLRNCWDVFLFLKDHNFWWNSIFLNFWNYSTDILISLIQFLNHPCFKRRQCNFFCLIQWQSIGYWVLHLPYGKWRRDELWTFLCKSCKFVFGPFLYILYQTSFCRPLFANLSNFLFYDFGTGSFENMVKWSKLVKN